MNINTSWAVIVGSVLIAACVLATNHWEIATIPRGADIPIAVARLNRWTGSLEICVVDASALRGDTSRGVPMVCPSQ